MENSTAKEARRIIEALNYSQGLEITGSSTEQKETYKEAAERSEKLLDTLAALEKLGEAIEAWEYETAEKLRVITRLWVVVEKLRQTLETETFESFGIDNGADE